MIRKRLLVALLLSGCSGTPTTVRVNVAAESDVPPVFQLSIDFHFNGATVTHALPATPSATPIALPTTFTATLPDAMTALDLHVVGLDGAGGAVASGDAMTTTTIGAIMDVAVTLHLGGASGDGGLDQSVAGDSAVGDSAASDSAVGDSAFSDGNMPDFAARDGAPIDSATASDFAAACKPGFANCSGNPMDHCDVNTATDPSNCGGCGRACSSAHVASINCFAGICTGGCATGFADCNHDKLSDGCEVDVFSDVNNCGACGAKCNQACNSGVCGGAVCMPGQADCDKNAQNGCEVNLTSDPNNCGACGSACSVNHVPMRTCANSLCKGACAFGFADCNNDELSDGCEANILTDVMNCGMCGRICPAPHAIAGCNGAKCVVSSCNSGFADCNRLAADGCEVSLLGDPANCGGCNVVCPPVANGASGCAMGKCGVAACNSTFKDCDGNPTNGCEVNTAIDPRNCNGCGALCPTLPNAVSGCSMGKCGIGSCNPPYRDCNSNAQDGCEVNTGSDPGNCGQCGRVCGAVANGSAGCSGGVCGIGSCIGSYRDCNGSAVDGCEANTLTDPKDCGACGKVCPAVANGSAACLNGSCGIGSCSGAFRDCNSNPNDGCEVNISSDIKNCGACGRVCPDVPNGSPACTNGMCGAAQCMAPFRDCDGNPLNGCETDTSSSLANCGACNNACPQVANGTPGCNGGKCGIAVCSVGFKDCDGNPANGCEVNLNSDPGNCGACSVNCSSNNIARACNGTCDGACNAGFADCNNNKLSDGCEVNTTDDSANCGGCGVVCAMGLRCSASVCVCDGASCPNGCCLGGQCHAESAQTCGTGGGACSACNPSLADGCTGGACSCGGKALCGGADTCGGGGVPGVCGCTPKTCMSANATCGSPPDGCGGVIQSCGTCVAPATCGGGGVTYACGCTDDGIACAGRVCGSAVDNCGKTISCGTCPGGGKCCGCYCAAKGTFCQ